MAQAKMPFQVWILTLSAFTIGTAEFVIAGLLKEISKDLSITVGMAGNLITAYALAIVVGGPILTLYLARFDKSRVLMGLLMLFVGANVMSWLSEDYLTLLISRVLAGLTQGPFYGIGAVVATRLVADHMAGRAVGQMFAGLTLANLLGVPFGTWIGTQFNWNATFLIIAILGIINLIAVKLTIPYKGKEEGRSFKSQISVFADPKILSGLIITILLWTGFMAIYGYVSPFAQDVAGFAREDLTWILIIIGVGLLIGNWLGGKSSDKNLSLSLTFWPIAMIASFALVGFVGSFSYLFIVSIFIFGIASFANVPALQMRVMMHGKKAPELVSTANISAFNAANAAGGFIGSVVVDYGASVIPEGGLPWTASVEGVSLIPFVAIVVPLFGLAFLFLQSQFDKKNQ